MEAAEVLKEQVLKVLDDLPPQQVAQVLDFALFVKGRHAEERVDVDRQQQAAKTDVWELLRSLQGSVERLYVSSDKKPGDKNHASSH
ncbi:MAG: hypothetical protein M1546_25775 [Chloroflexi bacterium]|nr:hypothetical protein [Chloroflexota bacterium]